MYHFDLTFLHLRRISPYRLVTLVGVVFNKSIGQKRVSRDCAKTFLAMLFMSNRINASVKGCRALDEDYFKKCQHINSYLIIAVTSLISHYEAPE